MAERDSKAKDLLFKAAVALITPLFLASVTGTAAILWNMQPTLASHTERLDKLEKKADRTEAAATTASERQVEIRVRLERMDTKLDAVLKALDEEN